MRLLLLLITTLLLFSCGSDNYSTQQQLKQPDYPRTITVHAGFGDHRQLALSVTGYCTLDRRSIYCNLSKYRVRRYSLHYLFDPVITMTRSHESCRPYHHTISAYSPEIRYNDIQTERQR